MLNQIQTGQNMEISKKTLLGTGLITIYFILGYIISKKPEYLFLSSSLILVLVVYVFEIKKYNLRWYFILSMPFIILQGLSLIYWYLSWPIYSTGMSSVVLFCVFAVLYVFLVLMLILSFKKRHKYDNYY
jgi:phosphoglycerol transferase MdoB-like AlkP superfamily enzyme